MHLRKEQTGQPEHSSGRPQGSGMVQFAEAESARRCEKSQPIGMGGWAVPDHKDSRQSINTIEFQRADREFALEQMDGLEEFQDPGGCRVPLRVMTEY